VIYQNLLNDYGFKYVFSREKFLVSFLNQLLQGKEKIKSATLLNPEFLGETEEERRAVFDIYCENEKGEKILLEMQNCNQKYFLDRSIYYSSFLIQRQGEKGDWDYQLKKMYVIGILNFIPAEMKKNANYINRAKLVDVETNDIVSDKLTFIYVNLPKFEKKSDELKTVMDYWLYTLIHSRQMQETDAVTLRKRNFFAELLDIIRLNKLNETEMEAYQKSEFNYEKFKRIYLSGTLEEGRTEGRIEGIEIGRQQEAQQIALNALKRGYSIKEVSALTDLPISEIEKLQK
jgi:predicted transposase/invertase (TIGR01784 family)